MPYVLVFGIAAAVSLLVTPTIRYFALRFSILDRKEKKKIQPRIITRFCGFAIYIGFMFAMATAYILNPDLKPTLSGFAVVAAASTLILFLGIYDDAKGAEPYVKLFVQVLASLILVYYGFVVTHVSNPFGEPIALGAWSIPVTVLWLVGITNAINLIDGLDGLASGLVLISCAGLFYIFYVSNFLLPAHFAMALAGACLGFLRYNFPPAKVFMGDTGSMFLGFSVGALAVLSSHKGTTAIGLLVPAVICLGIPVADTTLAFFRRIFVKKMSPFKPDNEHIHHVLLKLKFSERRAVFILWLITCALNIAAIVLYHYHN